MSIIFREKCLQNLKRIFVKNLEKQRFHRNFLVKIQFVGKISQRLSNEICGHTVMVCGKLTADTAVCVLRSAQRKCLCSVIIFTACPKYARFTPTGCLLLNFFKNFKKIEKNP